MALSYTNFDWSTAPMSSFAWPLVGAIGYLTSIYTIQWYIKTKRNGEGYDVNGLFGYHNLVLCVGSLIMFIGATYEGIGRWQGSGTLEWILCEPVTTKATGPLFFWSYIYYLSKYYELFDTVFLALKGKLVGWGGLQVYHHTMVLFMSWNWMQYAQTLQLPGLMFNTSVHVLMYYYFYLSSRNIRPKWRKWVTRYQILQFVTSIVLFVFTLRYVFAGEDCSGLNALYFNGVFNVTLLSEFVQLARKPPPSSSTPPPAGGAGGNKKAQ